MTIRFKAANINDVKALLIVMGLSAKKLDDYAKLKKIVIKTDKEIKEKLKTL